MKYLVTGGTGTLGSALIQQIVKNKNDHVVSLSRCEDNQEKLLKKLNYPENLVCKIGDVKDSEKMNRIFEEVKPNYVFHLAAYKRIEKQEEDPMECVKTNVIGTYNVAIAAKSSCSERFVLSSTDKAVDPINVYGYTKALSEKICQNFNYNGGPTRFVIFRWGNVIGSRGSAVPLFMESLIEKKSVTITSRMMTRFWIPLQEAVTFMLDHFLTIAPARIQIPKMKSAKVVDVVDVLAECLGIPTYELHETGIRAGEKLHESLISTQWGGKTSLEEPCYTRDELKALINHVVKLKLIRSNE